MAEGFDVICQNCRASVPSWAVKCLECGTSMSAPSPRPFLDSASSEGGSYSPAWTLPPPAKIDLGAAPREYGGFWIRVAASLVDSLILLLPFFVLRQPFGDNAGLFTWAIDWLYFAFMESSGSQATIGKMVCGLKVADTNGNRISFARATGRYFAKILSAIPFCLGFAMVGWTRQKRGLHDFVAGTVVLRG
jgi:uncharacterized RDD family membrane protein YckC